MKMWYKTTDGIEVVNIKHNDFIYQISNAPPEIGDKCIVDLEHDPTYFITVKSFDNSKDYPLNEGYRYGVFAFLRDGNIDIYGVGKIVWTNNPKFQL